jgi:hypothetical protein
MDDGRVIERGTHEELMSARGTYYRMVRRQMEFSGTAQDDAELALDETLDETLEETLNAER